MNNDISQQLPRPLIRVFSQAASGFTRCSKLHCGVCDMFSCSLLSAAKCEHDRYGTLNTKRLPFIRGIDERGSPRKPVRAAGPLVEGTAFVHIDTQTILRSPQG